MMMVKFFTSHGAKSNLNLRRKMTKTIEEALFLNEGKVVSIE